MEQRLHLVAREQRGPRPAVLHDWCGKIAGEIRDRMLHACAVTAAVDRIVHPGAATLVRPGIEVEVELTDKCLRRVAHVEETHCRMPYRRRGLVDLHAEDGLDHPEHPGEHAIFREVLLQLLVG